jgi:hypothetical protein
MAINSIAIRNPFRELNNCITPSQHVYLALFNITLRSTSSFQIVLIPSKFCVETFCKAATAVVELLMMGVRTPETR